MTERRAALRELDTPTLLRRGVLALAGIGLLGTTVELVFLRHWSTATSLIVWPAIAVLAVGFALLTAGPSTRSVRIVRALAFVAALIGVIGVGFHVVENLAAGPLDRDYAATWDSMSVVAQWFAAVTGAVGPAPVLAPGAIAEIALALLVGTIRHPAFASESVMVPTPRRSAA